MKILDDDKLVVMKESLIDSGENAFVILAEFRNNAIECDVSDEEISSVLTEAMSKDYDYLKEVIRVNSFLV